MGVDEDFQKQQQQMYGNANASGPRFSFAMPALDKRQLMFLGISVLCILAVVYMFFGPPLGSNQVVLHYKGQDYYYKEDVPQEAQNIFPKQIMDTLPSRGH